MLQTLGDQATAVKSVAFSPDNKILMLALNNSTIKVYNTSLSILRQVLKGYINIVRELIFLLNSRKLMLVLNNNIIKL